MPFNNGPGEIIIVLLIAAMVAVPILLVVLLFRAVAGRGQVAPSLGPRSVLADRLARGEITQEEFDTATHALGLVDRPA
jgi:uncharacterized membrane protein